MAHSMAPIYLASRDTNKEDWDDTALIEAYDKAMGAFKDKLQARKGPQRVNGRDQKKKPRWNIGDHCRAVYAMDKLTYEAEILEIHKDDDLCVIRFAGFDNEELVELGSLQPSKGKSARAKQIAAARKTAEINWEVGDFCFALYAEDGLYYEAEILEIYAEDELCLVKFDGYENEEEVSLDDLLPLEASVRKEEKLSSPILHRRERPHSSIDETSSTFSSEPGSESVAEEAHQMRPNSQCSNRSNARRQAPRRHSSSHGRVPYCPPSGSMPVPFSGDMQEDLGPVLMAWYMAGFHTGYYQGRSSRLAGRCAVQSSPSLRHLR